MTKPMTIEEFKKCLLRDSKNPPSRHATKPIENINYSSSNDFDIVAIFAANSPHPLKSVQIGYAFRGDIPCNDVLITSTSISTDLMKQTIDKSINIQILSLNEAQKRAKEIDWIKVKIKH